MARPLGPICIADASALVHLEEAVFRGRPLIEWLDAEFMVWVVRAVKDEVDEFGDLCRRARRLCRKREVEAANLKRMESVILSGYDFDFANKKDRGERHSASLAVLGVRKGDGSQVLLLIDDFRAKRRFLDDLTARLPIGHLWSSLDFIVYLYFRHGRQAGGLFEDAEQALRTVVSSFGGGEADDRTGRKETDRLVEAFGTYRGRLEAIHQLVARI